MLSKLKEKEFNASKDEKGNIIINFLCSGIVKITPELRVVILDDDYAVWEVRCSTEEEVLLYLSRTFTKCYLCKRIVNVSTQGNLKFHVNRSLDRCAGSKKPPFVFKYTF